MKIEVMFVTFLVLFLVLINISIISSSNEIFLKSRHFTIDEGVSTATKSKIESIPKRAHILLQLENIPTIDERKELERKGIKLLSYVPDKAWFASIPSDKVDEIVALSNVRAINEILVGDKIDHSILEKGVSNYSTNEKGEAKLVIIFFNDISLEEASTIILDYNGTVKRDAPIINALVIFLPKDLIYQLASHDSVQWIDQHYEPSTTNDGSRAAIGVNAVQASPYNLKGSNVIVGEWDEACIDNTHDDLKDRVIQRYCDGWNSDHATHVAGTMLGNGSRSEAEGGTALQWRGMATNATVVSYTWWFSVDELYSDYRDAFINYNINLSTNSWGYLDWDGQYDVYTSAEDNITIGAIEERRIPIVWAAGNEQDDRDFCPHGPWKCLRSNAVAKNIITVGAINSDDDSMTFFSSWGPTDDGRVKPDIVAAGDEEGGKGYIKSTLLWNTYGGPGWLGTSMAAPAVSGSVVLMLENWRKTNNEDPLPSTSKAILIQTAKDLNNTGPDYTVGYGRINVTEAIDLMNSDNDNNVILEDSIRQGYKDSFEVNVSTSESELKITLVWDDYPGTPNADPALVNDLDLIVIAPNGSRYYPWTLDGNNPGNSAVRNQPDNLNNVEQVYVKNETDYSGINGTWTIEINGTSVPESKQTYSLVSNNLSFFKRNPTINQIQCHNSVDWVDCTKIFYGANLTQVRANCTSPYGYIINATFNLQNTTNNVLFEANATSNESDWWIYNNNDIIINESGEYKLTVTCFDNDSLDSTDFVKWETQNSEIENCSELYIEGQHYNLTQNIIPILEEDCIIISADNITLDCKGYWISNKTFNYSGVYSNQFNTTIKNCNISMSVSEEGYGIELVGANNSYIFNNTLNGQNRGLYLFSTNDLIIENNIVNLNTNGILLESSSNNNLINNTVNLNEDGISVAFSSNNNLLINNTANSNSVGVDVYDYSNNNILTNLVSNLNEEMGIFISNSSNNNITDSNLSLNTDGIELWLNSTNNIFLNCSYNTSTEYVETNSELIRKWYYRAYVNDSFENAINGANVSSYNSSDNLEFSYLTNSSGWINRTVITDYVNTGTRNYYSNYTINASKSGYTTDSHTYNVTANENNLNNVFTLVENVSVSECRVLNTVNTLYTQTADIVNNSLTDNCINITAENITLDCKGYSISSDDPYNGVYSDQFNTTIKNCNISMDGSGIYLKNTNNVSIINNSLGGNDVQNQGLYLKNVSYSNISDNNLSNNHYYGLIMDQSSYNIINNNVANIISGYGIYLQQGSNNNDIKNNNFDDNIYGLFFSLSNDNKIYSNTLNSENIRAIFLYASSRNEFIGNTYDTPGSGWDAVYKSSNSNDNTFKDSDFNEGGVYLSDSKGGIFLNVSYDTLTEYVETNSELTRKWYYRAYVNDSDGNPVANVNVTAFNSSGDYQFDLITNASGWTEIVNIIDYVNTGARNYYSNYTINASKPVYTTDSHTYNVTANENNLNNVFTLSNNIPTINSISATPSPQGFGENITIEVNITDPNGQDDIDSVLVGITPPGESETNYTMWNISSDTWIINNFTDFTNGTYSYTIYVNDSEGNTNSGSETFDMFVNLFVNIQTLEDNYKNNELVNITDPPDDDEENQMNVVPTLISKPIVYNMPLVSAVSATTNLIEDLKNEYKIVDYDNFYLAAKKIEYCSYKPDSINDGYKICKPIIILYNKRDDLINLDMAKDKFGFAITKAIRNNKLDIYYSTDYEFYNETSFNSSCFKGCLGNDDMFIASEEKIMECEKKCSYEVTRIRWSNWQETTAHQKELPSNKLIAIRFEFEIPQYSKASYNFSYNPLNFLLDPDISSCGTLDTAGETYTQSSNLEPSNGHCIIISAQNITYNGNGYWIRNTTLRGDSAGVYSNKINTVIKNSNISLAPSDGYSSGIGIKLYYADNSYVFNNTLNSQGFGIYMYSTDNTLIENNTANSNNLEGFYIQSSTNNNIIGNSIKSNGRWNIYLISSSDSNIIENNDIRDSENNCVRLYESSSNIYKNNKISGCGLYGIDFYTYGSGDKSSHNIFKDMNISASSYEIRMDYCCGGKNLNNTFLNVTYLTESISGSDSELIRKWYLDIQVNDTDGKPLTNANVTGYNKTNNLIDNKLTESNGKARLELIEYVNKGGTKTYYSDYTVNVTKTGFSSFTNSTINLTTNIFLNTVLSTTESKIINEKPTNTSVYILMKVQYYNETGWEDKESIYFNISPIRIQPGQIIKLDQYWNPNAWNTGNNPDGTYRAYISITDINNNTLFNFDGSLIEDSYNFSITKITAPDINFAPPTPENGSNQFNNNIFVNLSSSDTDDHYSFLDFNNDVVLWMRMDDINGSGDPWDRSSYSNNGTIISNAEQTEDGYFGKGFEFGGYLSYDKIRINDINYNPGEVTYSMWVMNKDVTKDYDGAFKNGDESSANDRMIILTSSTNGRMYFFNDYGILGPNTCEISNDRWIHVAVVVSNSSQYARMYVNGSLCSEDNSFSINTTESGNTTFIGARANYWNWNGSIDEVLIFNRTLSQAEISALYNASANQYYHNFTGLADGSHLFTGYAVDIFGNLNQTEERVVNII